MGVVTSSSCLEMKFDPLQMVAVWKRTSMLSNFCSMLYFSCSNAHNLVASLLNDIIELSVKYGVKENKNYTLLLDYTDEENVLVGVQLFLSRRHFLLFHRLIGELKSKDVGAVLDSALKADFSEFVFFVIMLQQGYDASVTLEPDQNCLNNTKYSVKTSITIALNLKENLL